MTSTHDTTQTTPPTERSLGYWLRANDALLRDAYAQEFAKVGITRREWRILSAIASDAELPERLRARLERGGKHLRALAERGLIARTDTGWALTPEGEAANERLTVSVQSVRDRVAGAVSEDDLATTRAALETIAREFGWTEDTRLPRRSHGPRGPHGRRMHPHMPPHPGQGFGGFGARGWPGACAPHPGFERGAGREFDRGSERDERWQGEREYHRGAPFGSGPGAGSGSDHHGGAGRGRGRGGYDAHRFGPHSHGRGRGRGRGREAAFERGFAAGISAARDAETR
ncbi:MarR family winged helix-turn-helix transcriptional regulator [Leucobacter luti]|uniref:DNA-binding MarR family transcriptional regulator n=1 Tax=Leucobacter luti TaxID=340320 RepID=A0A4Q7TZJ6_9MICO|nr:MarR family winged helix-turn-helix transcriptional regulator [Leucobacter luti]MBL3699026.1 hypothetical protein [Leucobacter luti]RZT66525.1 DNA-binding MarR family transcriptional regulator [Leucobacter luti]